MKNSLKLKNKFIPVNKPIFFSDGIASVVKLLKENWISGVLLKSSSKFNRDLVVKKLLQKNTKSRNFFYPMYKQKIFKRLKIFNKNSYFPNAELLSKNGLYPSSGLGRGYTKIKIYTHAIKGLAENDFILAAKIDNL